jgi:uncharacterized protein YdhG (YjbR/CyaY superfamily)
LRCQDRRAGIEDAVAKTDLESAGEYIATHPKGVQAILKRVRSAIRKAVPGAEEVISYRIPACRLHGGLVLCFAGWKQHYSLYPATDRVVEAFKDDLAPYEVDSRTIRLPLSEPVPVKLIERIARFRAKEAAQRVRARAAAPRKRQRARVDTLLDVAPAGSGAAAPGRPSQASPARATPRPATWTGRGRAPCRAGHAIMVTCTEPKSSSAPMPAPMRT